MAPKRKRGWGIGGRWGNWAGMRKAGAGVRPGEPRKEGGGRVKDGKGVFHLAMIGPQKFLCPFQSRVGENSLNPSDGGMGERRICQWMGKG
jgi:hypothetical protein